MQMVSTIFPKNKLELFRTCIVIIWKSACCYNKFILLYLELANNSFKEEQYGVAPLSQEQ